MSQQTAIVVGAGIVGLATARALSLKGYQVTVIERNLKAVGASVRNFGMVWPIGQPDGILYDRAIRSKQIWKEIADSIGLWYDEVGSLHLAYHDDEWEVLQELHASFSQNGRPVKLMVSETASPKVPVPKVIRNASCFFCITILLVGQQAQNRLTGIGFQALCKLGRSPPEYLQKQCLQ